MPPAGTSSVVPVHRVELRPSGRHFDGREDQSVLEAARAAGFELASSCRNGTCRACLRRLLAGRVEYRIPWPGLLPEERAEGTWVLPCVAVARSDLVLSD